MNDQSEESFTPFFFLRQVEAIDLDTMAMSPYAWF